MNSSAIIPIEMNDFARQKARHEYGHHISARIMGFQTGEVTLKILNENREHVGSSEVFVHMPLQDTSSILDYLERRIVVLFSGAMAEAPAASMVGDDSVEEICFKSDGGGRDHVQIIEHIALHLNISEHAKMQTKDVKDGRNQLYTKLRTRAMRLVSDEFALIDGLAADHVDNMKAVTRGWAWGVRKEDLDSMPQICSRFLLTQTI